MFGVFAYVVYDDDNADRDDIKYMKPVYYIYIYMYNADKNRV